MFTAPLPETAGPAAVSASPGIAGEAPAVVLSALRAMEPVLLPAGPGEMPALAVDVFGGLPFPRHQVQAGQLLFGEGDEHQFMYAVFSGSFKSHRAGADGGEQIVAFHISGELMGLDGLSRGRHASSASALEDAQVCAIPCASLGGPEVEASVSSLVSREIVREKTLLLLLGTMGAEEKLAAFLLNLSQRLKARSHAAGEFDLKMSREEIGSYLGIPVETVSRTMSAFQSQRLIEVDQRHVRILDAQALARTLKSLSE